MKRTLWTFALVLPALVACSEPPPPAPPTPPVDQDTPPPPPPVEDPLKDAPPEAPPAPGTPSVSTADLELAIDMVRAQTGGPEQIPDKQAMSAAEIDALLYKIAMDPEASAIYAHETSPNAAEQDPADMDRSPPPKEP